MGRINDKIIDSILRRVQKPGRYCGGELNSIEKESAFVRLAVSYPDLYEVAMSNNGIKILYDAANRLDSAACERVFAVDLDMEKILRDENVPLFTLETRTPLAELDMIGFNLSHELLITNVLQILDLGKIKLTAAERGDDEPVIVAGGGALSNPAPYAIFFDALFVGEGEQGIIDIINSIAASKRNNFSRADKLKSLAAVESVYVPAVHGRPSEMKPGSVTRRIFRSAEPCDPLKPVLPGMRSAQDRAVIEVTRGCPNLCKFCHAGYYDLPYRKFNPESVAARINEILANTGYDEVTFSSLSVSDYPAISELINLTLPGFTERGISVSFPSLRVDKTTIPLIEQVSELRGASLTFAVESGSSELRGIANKKVYEDELLEITGHLFNKGWRLLKFYFMLGLPGCEEHDEADAAVELIKKIIRDRRGVELNVTLSPFVPKPHTPFERERMMGADYFYEAVRRVKQGLPKTVKIKSHDIKGSIVEGVLSRGDESLSAVILDAYSRGARLDSWSEHFKSGVWMEALESLAGGFNRFLEKTDSEILPWSFVSTGYPGLADRMRGRVSDLSKPREIKAKNFIIDTAAIKAGRAAFMEKLNASERVFMRFTKTGRAKYLSHLDYVEVLKRAMRMADLPFAYSQGFSKRERLANGNPIPLGIESESELAAADLWRPPPPDFLERMNRSLPQGITLAEFSRIDVSFNPAAKIEGVAYELFVEGKGALAAAADFISRRPPLEKETKGVKKTVLFEDAVREISAGENSVTVAINSGDNSVRIDQFARQLFGKFIEGNNYCRIVKKGQYIEGKFY